MQARPLAIGETATLTHTTSFHYSTPPLPEFRRVVQIHVQNLDIRVEFHPDKRPATSWGRPGMTSTGPSWSASTSPWTVSSRSILTCLSEKTTAGFHWDW
jgi:hypothetical protein